MKKVEFSEVAEGMPFYCDINQGFYLKAGNVAYSNHGRISSNWHENSIVKIPDTEQQRDMHGWVPVFKYMKAKYFLNPSEPSKYKKAFIYFKHLESGYYLGSYGVMDHIETFTRVREILTPEKRLENEAKEFAKKYDYCVSDGIAIAKESFIAGAKSRGES